MVYFSYGIWHSKEGKKYVEDIQNDDQPEKEEKNNR